MNTTSTLNNLAQRELPTHTYAGDIALAVARTEGWARAARILGRQAARENWTWEFRFEMESSLGIYSTIFLATFNKFCRDSQRIVTVGTTDDQGYLNILQADPSGEISDNWIYPRQERLIAEGRMYATEKPWPIPAPKPAKRATETLTPRMTGYSAAFTYCENENCRAYCCK